MKQNSWLKGLWSHKLNNLGPMILEDSRLSWDIFFTPSLVVNIAVRR